jgi:hypothetical protein
MDDIENSISDAIYGKPKGKSVPRGNSGDVGYKIYDLPIPFVLNIIILSA